MNTSEIDEDEFLEVDLDAFSDETTCFLGPEEVKNTKKQSIQELRLSIYEGLDNEEPPPQDVLLLINQLSLTKEASSVVSPKRQSFIDSRTFTRPKKSMNRPSLSIMLDSNELGTPKTRVHRKLTTTICPTPNLVPKLEALSKSNNRPVSTACTDVNWEDGCIESLAEFEQFQDKSKFRRSVPASVFQRLEELKKSNNSFMLTKNNGLENGEQQSFTEDFHKIKLNFDLNTTESVIGDIEQRDSFINTDDFSGLIDKSLTCSSLVLKDFREQFDHNNSDNSSPSLNNKNVNSINNKKTLVKNEFNRTFTLGEESSPIGENINKEQLSHTYELGRQVEKEERTFLMSRKSGLCDVICQETNILQDINKDDLNKTLEKLSADILAENKEKYSTKLFDSTFTKQIKKESTFTKNCNGVEDENHSPSNKLNNIMNTEPVKNGIIEPGKVQASTPTCRADRNKTFTRMSRSFSPIPRLNVGTANSPEDSENEKADSRTSSNSSIASKGDAGPSYNPFYQDDVRRPVPSENKKIYKIPQKELKLKPALNTARVTQTLKKAMAQRPEPVISRKTAGMIAPINVPGAVPLVSNNQQAAVKARASGIPRPSSRIRAPQVRTSGLTKYNK